MNITDPEIRALLAAIDTSMTSLRERQVEVLAKRLAAAFVLGTNITGEKKPITPKIDISNMQKNAIKELTAIQMGYITEFNEALEQALKKEIETAVAEGKTYADVKKLLKPRIKELFSKNGQVVIDRVGQTRRVVHVARDGSLRWIDKPITKRYITNIDNYCDMLSRTVMHGAYVKGRSVAYQSSGLEKWRYMAVMDERTRPSHAALHGRVFQYGTEDSEMAENKMLEPNCRCTATAFFDDPSLDTPQSVFEEEQQKAGLVWDDTKEEWTRVEPSE